MTCPILVKPFNELLATYGKRRRVAKDAWLKGLKQVNEAIAASDKAHATYRKCYDQMTKAKEALKKAEVLFLSLPPEKRASQHSQPPEGAEGQGGLSQAQGGLSQFGSSIRAKSTISSASNAMFSQLQELLSGPKPDAKMEKKRKDESDAIRKVYSSYS